MKIHDKEFEMFIGADKIDERVKDIAKQINKDYSDNTPLFIAILNGSFMFASDLMKEVNVPCEISFVRVASYEDMQSSGDIKKLIGLSENIFNREVIVIEDIIDSGLTMDKMLEEFNSLGAKRVTIASLLTKPDNMKSEIAVKYLGFEIPNKFVVGYGLDYNGQGRNLKDIYQLK
jgi:hypoxanthine phosphoribosyltransferase